MPQGKKTTALTRYLTQLSRLKSEFTPQSAREKQELITTLTEYHLGNPVDLIEFHEQLCYMQAYPDTINLLKAVNRALATFPKRIQALKNQPSNKREALDNTGIVDTTIHYRFSFHTAKWLYQHYANDITIAWDDFEQQSILLEFLPTLTSPLEAPALEHLELETESWVKYASAAASKTDFEWTLGKILCSGIPEPALESIYELIDLPLNWALRSETISRTFAQIPLVKTAYQKETLTKKVTNIGKHIRSPMNSPKWVTAAKGRELIARSMGVLSVRCREIYPLFYGNPRDVMVIQVAPGYTFVFVGMKPSRRFSLESTYFFLGLKNNIPITYGSGTLCFDQAEVATNIFESFRQAESALVYAHVMRAFHKLFGARAFLVQKFQIGAEDNEDAINSGAFWFYHKLGFRPIEPAIAAIAKREDRKRHEKRGYRSPAHVLKKLATSDMRYFVTGSTTLANKLCLPGLALLTSKYIGIKADTNKGTQGENQKSAVHEVCRLLHIKDETHWTGDERFWLQQFSPLLSQIPNLSKWPKAERKNLVRLIRAKGKAREVEYIRLWIGHKRFQKALCTLSKKGQKTLTQLTTLPS